KRNVHPVPVGSLWKRMQLSGLSGLRINRFQHVIRRRIQAPGQHPGRIFQEGQAHAGLRIRLWLVQLYLDQLDAEVVAPVAAVLLVARVVPVLVNAKAWEAHAVAIWIIEDARRRLVGLGGFVEVVLRSAFTEGLLEDKLWPLV